MGDSIVYASYAAVEKDNACGPEPIWAFRAYMPARREGAIAVSICKPESHGMHSCHMGVLLTTSGQYRGSVQVAVLDSPAQYFELVSGIALPLRSTVLILQEAPLVGLSIRHGGESADVEVWASLSESGASSWSGWLKALA